MYAHQVIESLNQYKPILERKRIEAYRNEIKQSQKFNLGNISSFEHIERSMVGKIMDTAGKKMPYPRCWIDYHCDRHEQERESTNNYESQIQDKYRNEMIASPKRGILATEASKNFFIVTVFNGFSGSTKYSWQMSPVSAVVALNGEDMKSFCKHSPSGRRIASLFPEQTLDRLLHGNPPIIPFPVWPPGTLPGTEKGWTWEMLFRFHLENRDEYTAMVILMDLLSCRNISLATNEPPVKINRKRKTRGKCPIFTYKTLVIKPTSKKQQEQEAQGLWNNRIHLCRGHFKEYTPEKPLFGKFTGRYWWQPSVRGKNKNGVVMKDYEVRT